MRLTEPWHRRLYGLAVTLCKDPDLAGDLTQEALVRAFEAFDRFDREAPVFPWLTRILRNHYVDILRSGRVRFEVPEHQLERPDGRPAPLSSEAPCPDEDALAQVERSQLRGWLHEEIERLPEDQRLVVRLCDVNGLSYEEAAEVAQTPIGTVRSRLSRARLLLRQRLRARVAGVGRSHTRRAKGNRR